MRKAISKKLAFKLLAATASLGVTTALIAASAPAVHAAQTGGVQGTVKDANGQPIQGAEVLLQGGGLPQHARTDGSGYYSFAGVQPGAYTLQINVVTFNSAVQSINIQQDINASVDVTLTKKTVNLKGGRISIAPTNRNSTLSEFSVTARDEQREKSQPNELYQSSGLLDYKPGVTEDAGQYPRLRGSDQNQIDYEVDGIDIRDPVFNGFATNLVTVGVRSTNVVTGAASGDYGGASGGYLNQITVNGRDIAPNKSVGGFLESTFGPGAGWAYKGINSQIGGVLFNNKVDYALSTIDFSTRYPGNYQLSELHSSQDTSGKINFYASPSDLLTVYYEHGAENYNTYQTSPNSVFFDPDKVLIDSNGHPYYSARDLGSNFNDHSVQTNDLEHFTYKHNFTPSSFLQYRIYQVHQAIPDHEEETENYFSFLATNITGNQVDYSNQISKTNTLKAGLQYTDDKGSYLRQIVNVQTGPLDPKNNPSYSDRIYAAYPKDFAIYLADQLRALDNKLTLDLGARLNSVTYAVQDSKYLDSIGQSNPSGYTTKSTDPRLGLGYSPRPDLTFRTSYGINSQRPDMRRIQRVAPFDVDAIGTIITSDPASQLSQSQADEGILPLSHVKLSHAKDFDFGVEKAFNLTKGMAQGLYSVNIKGYTKYVYDLTYQASQNFDLNAGPQTPYLYDNEGTSHVSGVEVSLRKIQRKPSDWSGYVNYTNQVARANVLSNNGYTPTFSYNESGNSDFTDSANDAANGIITLPGHDLRQLNHIEFPTDADQRHTIGIVVNKRVSRLFDTTLILDAGSGLPFFSSATSDSTLTTETGSVGPGFAAVHTITGGDSNFTQVPILLGGNLLPPVNPVTGYTGWHYKIAVNSNFNLTPDFSLFLNVDNIFDKKTALSLATGSLSGEPYWTAPTPQYPQGQEHFGSNSILTPIFVSIGFRQKF
jgi:hypothetical protein